MSDFSANPDQQRCHNLFTVGHRFLVSTSLRPYCLAHDCHHYVHRRSLHRKLAILGRRPVVSGLVYGGAIYLFMNFIVLPLSGVPHPRSAVTIASRGTGVLALLLFIGFPISLLVRRYLNERTLRET